VKLIGGLEYGYAVKGEPGTEYKILEKGEQMKALLAVLETLNSQNLAIPEHLLKLFPPRAYGYSRSRESFKSNMGVAFDPLGAAATASDMTLRLLLHPERVNRLVLQNSLDSGNIELDELLHMLVVTVFDFDGHMENRSEYRKEIERTIQYITLQRLLNMVASPKIVPQVKATANNTIDLLERTLINKGDTFSKQLVKDIKEFREHPEKFKPIESPQIPDGSPIGSFQCGMYYN
jgi:hypothetical protein